MFVYQVGESVNVKHKNGNFYGAFVSCVNPDGTYQVYFTEDSEKGFDVAHKDIKKPISTVRQKAFDHWSKYKGKVFFDEGTTAEEQKGIPNFEAGEFVVDSVDSMSNDNNFLCCRVGSTDKEKYPFDIGYVLNQIRLYEEE